MKTIKTDFNYPEKTDFNYPEKTDFNYPEKTDFNYPEFSCYMNEQPYSYASPKEDLSGKVYLTNKQTVGISLLVHAVFFGILALLFPPASVPYAICIGLSVSCAVAGGALLAFREKPVEIPLESDFCEFC